MDDLQQNKKIYHYHEKTLNYIGSGTAWLDPMEPGKYIIPAHSTELEPPSSNSKFVDGKWIDITNVGPVENAVKEKKVFQQKPKKEPPKRGGNGKRGGKKGG